MTYFGLTFSIFFWGVVLNELKLCGKAHAFEEFASGALMSCRLVTAENIYWMELSWSWCSAQSQWLDLVV